MSRLVVELASQGGGSFNAHRVVASFEQEAVEPGAGSVKAQRRTAAAADEGGRATFELPALSEVVDGSIQLSVVAPDGQILAKRNVDRETLARGALSITVAPKEYFPIERNEDPSFGLPARVRGFVVDPSGRASVGGRQVTLRAQRAGDGAEADILAVASTDARGYFSVPYPSGKFARAEALVAPGGTRPISIRLGDEGAFPERLVLGIEDGLAPNHSPASVGVVPRDPDVGDRLASPETFTDDVGGRCMDFRKPNRVLESFDYHTVVRSTEPEIKGLTIEEPPKVPIDTLIGILQPRIANYALAAQAAATPTSATGPGDTSVRRQPAASTAIPGSGFASVHGVAGELEHLSEVLDLAALRAARSEPAAATMTVRLPATSPSGASATVTSALEGVRIEAQILKTLATDPDGFSLTRLAAAELMTRKNDLLRIIELLKKRTDGRTTLGDRNPVDWDDEPTFYQATTIAHGHLLHFKQEWVADGYSLGDLLYSLPLAPCQKKQIAVIDWDRRETASRRESLDEQERLTAQLSRDRDISEIANAFVRETLQGGSEADTSSFGGGLGIGAIIGPVGGLLGIGGGTSAASSSAWQDSSRSTSASSLQRLRDRVSQAASAVRSQRSTVVQTVRQGESVRVQTEVVANHNHAHALTMQYFEVLRHFLVRHRLADVQECLLVPFLMSRFESAKARRWRTPLSLYLRDRSLLRGFDALQRIADNYAGSDFPIGSYAEEELEDVEGFLRIQFHLQRPRDNDDATFRAGAWTSLSWLGFTPLEWWENHLKSTAEKDREFLASLGPRIAREIVNGLRIYAVDESNNELELKLDATLVSEFQNDSPLYVSLRLSQPLPPLRRDRIRFIRIGKTVMTPAGEKNVDEILPDGSRVLVHSGQVTYRTPHIEHSLFDRTRILDDLSGTDGVLVYTPLTREEKRRPRVEDAGYARALLKHLNEHLEHYHRAIWWSMDAQRRYMLLDGFVAPNASGRSVASVVENRLAGIVGNCLVMPVARGFHLDPTFRQDVDHPIDLLEHYQPNTPIEPVPVAVPTKGVFCEGVLGSCPSAEKIDESRFWRWEESPCPDEPTPIQAIDASSRRADPGNLSPNGFPAPIVAFQNVPTAPDPQGIAALTKLLATPNLFRDVTGLTENQKNALAALQGALGTAQFFGGKAADLALQGAMRRDVDKALDKIRDAKQTGLINDEQARNLTESALRSMIGGGTEPINKKTLTSEPAVKKALDTAGSTPGGEIQITRNTGGASETLGVKTPGAKDTGRTYVIAGAGLTPERRAFHPRARDKSGRSALSVRVPELPAGGSVRWSAPPGEAGSYTLSGNPATVTSSRTGTSVEIIGLRPGLSAIDVEVLDAGGAVLESQKLRLCLPQFVSVDLDAATFRPVLTAFKLDADEADVLRVAQSVCDIVLSTANVRTVWLALGERLPAQYAAGGIAAGRVTRAVLRGDPPSAALYGRTSPGAGGVSPADHDETIDVFLGAFDDAVSGNANEDVDEVTNEITAVIVNSPLASTPERQVAVQIIGRLIGETLAHEIGHSLIGPTLTDGFHNAHPGEPSDIMNAGIDRSFQSRTGFEILAPVSTGDFSNLVDRGIGTIDIPTGAAQRELDDHFPVPPRFA